MELKIDFSNKKAIAGIIVLVAIISLVLYSPGLIALTNPATCIEDGVCLHEQRLYLIYELIPVFVIVGIIVGALVFFFMSSRIDKKQGTAQKVAETMIDFLNKDEKKVVRKILEENGKVLQAEVSRIEGIGKLKSHRILQRLKDRGVIEIEETGKTNTIKLAKPVREALDQK